MKAAPRAFPVVCWAQQRVAAHVHGRQLVMAYPDWNKPKCLGVGRYRMSVDLPQDRTIRNLVHHMVGLADCLGILLANDSATNTLRGGDQNTTGNLDTCPRAADHGLRLSRPNSQRA